MNLQDLHDTIAALLTGTGGQAVLANPAAVEVVVVDGTPAHERAVTRAVFDADSGYFVQTIDPIPEP